MKKSENDFIFCMYYEKPIVGKKINKFSVEVGEETKLDALNDGKFLVIISARHIVVREKRFHKFHDAMIHFNASVDILKFMECCPTVSKRCLWNENSENA